MIAALDRRHNRADRFIWPKVVEHQPNIERGIRYSLDNYERVINKQLGRR